MVIENVANTYAILGAGAVGGFYGARLAQAGLDVSFLLRSDLEHVRKHGLQVFSPDGDFVLPHVRAYRNVADMEKVDVVIVALKATANDVLPDILPHLVRPGGTVVLLQNGLGGEASIAAAARPARIVGGLAFVCATKIGPGTIRHFACCGIDMAPWTPDGRPEVPGSSLEHVAADFQQAGIPVRLLDNLELARWRKLTWNIPFGGLCITRDSDTRRILDDPDGLATVRALMTEVAASAAACGHDIDNQVLQQMIDETLTMPAYRPSLKVDFDAGAAIELEAIFGNPLSAARRAGYEPKLVDKLYRQLQSMERARPSRLT